MLFNSINFIFIFLPITLIAFFLIGKLKEPHYSKIFLIGASLFFYGYWKLSYLGIIISSILINYFLSKKMLETDSSQESGQKIKKALLIVGLVFNTLLLCYYKYMDFFIENMNTLFSQNWPLWKIVLPLGISFFTLQQMAYLVDAYDDLCEDKSFINYALFVAFFPQLVAGPIVHHQYIMPGIKSLELKLPNFNNLSLGLFIFSIGLFKKVVIADNCATLANYGFENIGELNCILAWATSIAYTFQMYFDFSGYSDMAIGLGSMFNLTIPINFNSPYRAKNVTDYWQRWHMTLTSLITHYLYTFILKSFKKITFRNAMIATFLSMFIAGIWHGSSWTFVWFGAIHGLALVIAQLWFKLKRPLPTFLAWALTMNVVNVALIFFRANQVSDAFSYLKNMFAPSQIILPVRLSFIADLFNSEFFIISRQVMRNSQISPLRAMLWGGLLLAIVLLAKNTNELKDKFKSSPAFLLFTLTLFVSSVFFLDRQSIFLYFNF